MAKQRNTSLVPVAKKLPAVRSNDAKNTSFTLYEGERHFTGREDVREFLPDILGKALARTWIDPEFHSAFDKDPCGTLESQNADRPRIVVYEQQPNSKFKMRVLYLQLVMMAGR